MRKSMKSAATFFLLFVVGSVILRAMGDDGFAFRDLAPVLVTALIAAAIFALLDNAGKTPPA